MTGPTRLPIETQPGTARNAIGIRRFRRTCGATLLGAVLAGPAVSGRLMAQTPNERPVFRTRLETVYIDAFVSKAGRPVLGLKASDFELKDNGVGQNVELVAVEALPLLAVLVLDTSASVAGEKMLALRSASEALLEGLRPRDEVALITFSAEIRWLVRPTLDRDAIRNAIGGLKAKGATAVLDALYAGVTLVPSPTRGLVVLFSDGEDNLSWLGQRQVRDAAERSNALLEIVGLRSLAASSEPREPDYFGGLREIAELTGGRLWEARSPARLRDAFVEIVETMNTRYVLGYEPHGGEREGWHRIELRLKGHKGLVHTRRGYWRGARS